MHVCTHTYPYSCFLQLIDLQWKLGVSVGSSSCKNLNSPFVTMTIKVAEPSGHLKTRSFEMTIAQFQVTVGVGWTLVLFSCVIGHLFFRISKLIHEPMCVEIVGDLANYKNEGQREGARND